MRGPFFAEAFDKPRGTALRPSSDIATCSAFRTRKLRDFVWLKSQNLEIPSS